MNRSLATTLLAFAFLSFSGMQRAQGQEWQLTDGAARDVGVGPNGAVWIVGTDAVPGGHAILRRVDNAWVAVPGGGERIAVGPRGLAWIVTDTQKIQRYDGAKWVTVAGQARDIGVGANGTVWVIGNNPEAGGYGIYRSTDNGANWTKIPGAAVRVSVDPQGNAWVVNSTNNIFRFNGSSWVPLVGAATDVGVGPSSARWVIGTDGGIYRWENNNWAKKTGSAAQIAAGPKGIVWVVNQDNQIWNTSFGAAAPAATAVAAAPTAADIPQANIDLTAPTPQPSALPTANLNLTPPAYGTSGPVTWARMDGAARDIAVGADGTIWAIGTTPVLGGYGIYRRSSNAWVNVPGGAERIAVDPQGNAWVVNNAQQIYRYDGAKFIGVNGFARDIGVGADGTLWIIGNNSEAGGYGIYRSKDKGASWTKVPGSALRITVDPQGNAWVVNNSNTIFRFDGNNWVTLPGSAIDISVGSDFATWATGTDQGIYRWENNAWVRKLGAATQIAAGPNGVVLHANQAGEIYQAQVQAQVASATPAIPSGPIAGTATITYGSAPVGTTPGTTMTAPTTGASGGSGAAGNLGIGSNPPTVIAAPGAQPIVVSGGVNTDSMIGPIAKSQALCGVPGKGWCADVAADLVGNADVTCPSGSFADLGMSACYSCPGGYNRSGHAVTDFRACMTQDSSVKAEFKSASFKGPLCGGGSFYDLYQGGGCYSCPDGYERSIAHITESWACLTPLESFSRATRHNSGLAWDCSSDTFWDGYDGGACWSCPNGYRRTAYHITDAKACARTQGQEPAHAKLVKKAECGPGEIQDAYVQGTQNPAYGGGCWTCPPGSARSVNPIYGNAGCYVEGGVTFAAATRVKGMTCEPDQIYDPINSSDSSVSAALAKRNKNGAQVSAGIYGGTCWTCPAGYKRSGSSVYRNDACVAAGIVWQSAPYNQPGLFGLAGAEAVALKLVNDRTAINLLIRDTIAKGNSPSNYAQSAWDQIATRPQDSVPLSIAVFSRVKAAAANPSGATPDELALLADVIANITRFRVFMAQDALDAYLAWKGGQDFRKSKYLQSSLQTFTDIGEVPPDWQAITAENIMGSLAATTAVRTAIGLAMSSHQVFEALFPHAVVAIDKALVQAGMEAGSKAFQAAADAAASAAGAATSIGPQIIVTFGMVVLQVAIEQQIAIAEAEPKLRANLTTAQNFRADFPRLMSTPEGSTQAQSYWSMLMAGPAQHADGSWPSPRGPLNLAPYAQAAAAAKQALVAQAQ